MHIDLDEAIKIHARARRARFGHGAKKRALNTAEQLRQKGDHAGAVSSYTGKERMEFYPDELQRLGLYEEALALCDNVSEETAPAQERPD